MTWESGEQVSWLEVRVTPGEGGGARLELAHTVSVDAHWEQFGPGAVGIGWELGLMGMELHLASGTTVDRAEVTAWQATPPALDLMRRVGDAWGQARVAGGAPADEAHGMAERCIAAYTGN